MSSVAFKLCERELEVLRELESFCRYASENASWHRQWVRPMDVGGHDGSHHSRTLRRLVTKGLAERRYRGSARDPGMLVRGAYGYRITDAGRAASQ